MKRFHTLVAILLALITGSSTAGSLTVANYSTVNGNGKAVGGSKNYWDLCYGGVCDKTADNQELAGGTGDLTDGIYTSHNWATVESVSGDGPYVGWHRAAAPSVVIDFNFLGLADIDTLNIHADDANGAGGVSLPAKVLVTWSAGSRMFDVLDPATATPHWLVFAGLGIKGVSTVQVQIFHKNWWLFVDEIHFDGTSAAAPDHLLPVSEPPSLALAGLALLAASRLRRCTSARVKLL